MTYNNLHLFLKDANLIVFDFGILVVVPNGKIHFYLSKSIAVLVASYLAKLIPQDELIVEFRETSVAVQIFEKVIIFGFDWF